MYLKKVLAGNFLYNLGMQTEYEQYVEVKTDEELVAIYHTLLDRAEETNNKVLREVVFAMIAYSTGVNINPLILMAL